MVARFADVGTVVTKGQELAAPILPRRRSRCAARRRRANAEAQFVNAHAEEARQRDLVQRNFTPQAQYELVERNRETAQAS